MNWPWKRSPRDRQQLVYSLDGQGLHWLLARLPAGGPPQPLRHGLIPLDDSRRLPATLRELGLRGLNAWAVLPLGDYQMLQIDAPAVPAEELRAAARWHIRDRVDSHVDDLTLDVLRVGAPQAASVGQGQLLVVAAANTQVARVAQIAQDAGWRLQVIDVADMAQRNLHTAAAAALSLQGRATASLVRHPQGALLCICAGEELYYSRRLEWDDAVYERAAAVATPALAEGPIELLGQPDWPAPIELGAAQDDTPRLVVELQRSLDVWERSWPELPLAALMVHDTRDTSLCEAYLQDSLGLQVLRMPLAAGLADAGTATGATDAAGTRRGWPTLLLGGLLRKESREA